MNRYEIVHKHSRFTGDEFGRALRIEYFCFLYYILQLPGLYCCMQYVNELGYTTSPALHGCIKRYRVGGRAAFIPKKTSCKHTTLVIII